MYDMRYVPNTYAYYIAAIPARGNDLGRMNKYLVSIWFLVFGFWVSCFGADQSLNGCFPACIRFTSLL